MSHHEFILVDARKFSLSDYGRFGGRSESEAIKLSDDFCHYIADSLEWIPTVNPAVADNRPGFGLNFYGPTAILPAGAKFAVGVFSGWANLLRWGPDRFDLTAGWEMPANENEWQPRRFDVCRTETVNALQAIADMALQVRQGSHFLLHFGL